MPSRSSTPARRPLTRLVAGALAAGVVCTGGVVAGTTAAQAALPTVYVDTASTVWHYSDDNTDPASGAADRLAWTTQAFDDSGWKSAKGAFGAKNGKPTGITGFPITTLLNQYIDGVAAPDVKTFHFRTDITVSADDLAAIGKLSAEVTYDDAIQVFVNGQKVAGFVDERVEAAPAAERNLMYAGDSAGNPATSTFDIPAGALKAGENTIAVALYQDRETSSDIYFDFDALVPVPVGATTPTPTPSPSATAPAGTAFTDLVQTVGADESSRNVTWYTNTDSTQVLQYAVAGSGSAFPTSGVTTVPASGALTTSLEFNRRATITGLAENTSYVYRVGSDADGWSETNTITTKDFSGDFDFLFVGDPQIGASGNVPADQAGWTDTLDVALKSYPESELLFSAGDQVERAGNEEHYAAFLAPDALADMPLVPVNGNHDVGSKAYEQHYTVPNLDPTAGPATSPTSSGGDYWFMHKDVLFVVLNSNNRDTASHQAFMEKVVAEQGDKAAWKVLAFHHSIYSVAAHTNDTDILERRKTLPAVISDLDFDLVLQGHDHSYTRTYLIKDGAIADSTEVAGQSEVSAGDGEVLYVTANSASGSKYYDVKAPDAFFASVINQEYVRNYSSINVTADGITVTTLRSQQNGTDKPVNSVVDEVTLVRDDVTAPEFTLPAKTSVTVGDAFDPLAGVSASDARDGDVTARITVTGAVDTATEGTYTLEYSVTDAAGNTASATRTVTVVAAPVQPAAPVVEVRGEPVQGASITFAGSGFDADERLGAVVNSDPVDLGTITATAAGTVEVRWTIPADFTPGAHRIVVTRADGTTVSAAFTVAARAGTADPGSAALAATGGTLPLAAGLFGALLLVLGVMAVARTRARRA
jgi:hypothetical protein